MSALPPKADISRRLPHVCFVPIADIRGLRKNSIWVANFHLAIRQANITAAAPIAAAMTDVNSPARSTISRAM
jgi:hypothetical protein